MNIQNEKLVIAISSRALFNLDESHFIFEEHGMDAYRQHQLENEQNILPKGAAFGLVEKFLKLNQPGKERVEVILLSRNTADTGLRIFNTCDHYGLQVTRAVFSGGKSPYHYAKAFGAHLYLSLNPEDVKHALQEDVAAAILWASDNKATPAHSLNIAFDGDAVIFSDESERIYKAQGLDAFNSHEQQSAKRPLSPGPFKHFLQALQTLQKQDLPIPIRTALVTARSVPAHERVIRTLREWDIRIDESLFLGGLPKGDFLAAFGAEIFFDDQRQHCENANQKVTAGHVPYGVANS